MHRAHEVVMLDPNTSQNLIKEAMLVICTDEREFAVVDRIEGLNAIKLTKDVDGQHHYIPLSWVVAVDDKVHLDRSTIQAMSGWSTTAPDSPHRINSVDATIGQPIVARVMARKLEFEALLAGLPPDEHAVASDITQTLAAVNELLSGDLEHVPAVVAAELNLWLERGKHVAESALTPAAT
jgi:hypothetical protein